MIESTEEIPLFPLPGLVYYPGRLLPLHVFEERYRELMRDVLAADKRFAMAVFRPGWEPQYEERPAIFPIVCIGTVAKYRQLPDGRYVLHLRGDQRAKVLEEKVGKPYRVGVVVPIAEEPLQNGQQESVLTALERKIIELCGRPILPPYDPSLTAPPSLTAIDIADEATMRLPFPIEKKIELSSIPNHVDRIAALVRALEELIEMRKTFEKAKGCKPDNLMFN
jgi:Lon protease-like protein